MLGAGAVNMKRTLTTIRCVPRFGYDGTEVRTIDIELNDLQDDDEIAGSVRRWFATRGIDEALFDVVADDDGFFAVINDEAYQSEWGRPLL